MRHKYLPYLPQEDIPAPDPRRKAQTIQRCKAHLSRYAPDKSPFRALFRSQLSYQSALVWGSQALVLLIAIVTGILLSHSSIAAGEILIRLSPLCCLFTVPQMAASPLYQMGELEASCKYNSGTVLLVRVAETGLLNLLALSCSAGVLAGSFHSNFFVLLLYALVPFNAVNLLSLTCIRLLRVRFALAGHGAILLVALILSLTDFPKLLLEVHLVTWATLLIATTAALVLQTRSIIQHKEELLQWS